MKKIFLTLSLCAVVAGSVLAQVSGGLKVGANLSSFGGDAEGTSSKIGYHAGAYLNLAFSDKIALQPELLYNVLGSESKYSEVDYTEKDTYSLSYVSIPVMFMYNINKMINIQAGPQANILTSAKLDSSGEADGFKYEMNDVDVKDSFKSADFSINVGVGLNISKLSIAARYCIGVANIAEVDDSVDVSVNNNAVQLSVGYRLFGN